MRFVVAIDPALGYTSIACLREDGEIELGQIRRSALPERPHPAILHQRAQDTAERIADVIEGMSEDDWDTPALVILKRQEPRPYAKDRHAVARIGLHWALVGVFAARGIPVAEIGVTTATIALCGSSKAGYSGLTSKVRTLVPELPPLPDEKLYRVSTVALALLGALALGLTDRITMTEHIRNVLVKGGAFPPSVPSLYVPHVSPDADALTKRAAEWNEARIDELKRLPTHAFWVLEPPVQSKRQQAAYDKRVLEEIDGLADLSLAELEEMPTPLDHTLRTAVDRRIAQLNGEE
ncbi:hypothetical protein [Mycobacteroides franklinii]|uniref:hypothetical protein n=1 Tax=Mycobacteroides franklinii TaxID=948102 RepID=UPI000991AE60|nr:hypothetical protein [Mycobacteroides franklinii]